MGDWGNSFNLISIVYLGIAAYTVARLLRLGPGAFAEPLAGERPRLIAAASFYVLTPVAVALHELGHAAAIWALGGQVIDYHYILYWGYVVPSQSFGPAGDFAVALAGNLVTLAVGLGAALAVLWAPGRAAWNLLWGRLAEVQLSMVLVIYPVFCLLGFGGDFLLIYRRDTPWLSGPLLLAHLAGLATVVAQRNGRAGARFRLHMSPLWDVARKAERERAAAPTDPLPEKILAAVYDRAGLPTEAQAHAALASQLDPAPPGSSAAAGVSSERSANGSERRADPEAG